MIDLFKAEWVSSVCVQVSRNGRIGPGLSTTLYCYVFGDSVWLV